MAALKKSVSPTGILLIQAFESFSATRYLCPARKTTIGYGHVVRVGEQIPARISPAQAEALLIDDLAPIEIYLNAVLPTLTQNQFDALASFCFNVGLGAFEKSTLFVRLKAGDPAGAASQFARWIYADGKTLPGLVKRRAAERALFMGYPKK